MSISGRVCVVSHRMGGYDGLSVEAAKWVAGFETLGWRATRAAGTLLDSRPGDVTVTGLWARRPGGEPPPVDHATIQRLVDRHDLLVLDNAGTLSSAPLAASAFERHALAAGIPTIVRHHDPPWQGEPPRRGTDGSLPLRHPHHLHVLINQLTRDQFARRWPALEAAGALTVRHNRVDVTGLVTGDRDRTRWELGVRPHEVLLAHPARVGVKRKNVPGAVAFAHALAARLTAPVRYWLTDPAPADESPRDSAALRHAPGGLRGHIPRLADLYAACDLVLLPSTWEGWGLPVVEGAAARKPVVAGPYPVLDEIRGLGLRIFDPRDIDPVARLLEGTDPAEPLLDANRAAVRAHLDLARLPDILGTLAATATVLSRSDQPEPH